VTRCCSGGNAALAEALQSAELLEVRQVSTGSPTQVAAAQVCSPPHAVASAGPWRWQGPLRNQAHPVRAGRTQGGAVPELSKPHQPHPGGACQMGVAAGSDTSCTLRPRALPLGHAEALPLAASAASKPCAGRPRQHRRLAQHKLPLPPAPPPPPGPTHRSATAVSRCCPPPTCKCCATPRATSSAAAAASSRPPPAFLRWRQPATSLSCSGSAGSSRSASPCWPPGWPAWSSAARWARRRCGGWTRRPRRRRRRQGRMAAQQQGRRAAQQQGSCCSTCASPMCPSPTQSPG
jgi:hypothetical protein